MAKKGKSQRPIRRASIGAKRFKRVSPELPRRVRIPLHPMVVCADLRNGCLDSLAAYLKRHKGIADREVALELRKLLVGSASRTPLRIVVVDHPDAHPDSGGRPESKSSYPTEREYELAQAFRDQFALIGKVVLAREEAAETKDVSPRTIQRAVQKVEAHEVREAEGKADLE